MLRKGSETYMFHRQSECSLCVEQLRPVENVSRDEGSQP